MNCIVLYCIVLNCIILYCTVLNCNVLYFMCEMEEYVLLASRGAGKIETATMTVTVEDQTLIKTTQTTNYKEPTTTTVIRSTEVPASTSQSENDTEKDTILRENDTIH